MIAIDRERCILCYRCVRFSQEIAEDYQLVLLERGAHSYVGTLDGHPYVAPFSGNIIELCPVGALTSQPYRFRARPWDIEASGSVCTLCPAQCNVSFTVRDERVLRVLAATTTTSTTAGCATRAASPTRRSTSTSASRAPLLRDGGELRQVSWERALDEAAAALQRAGGQRRRARRRRRTNEEGFLLPRLMREGLGSADIDSRARRRRRRSTLQRALAAPARCRRRSPTSSSPTPCSCSTAEPLDDMPILDLRIRKGVRRNGVKLRVATQPPLVAGRQRRRVACATRPAPARPSLPALARRWTAASRPSERAAARLAATPVADADAVRALGARAAGRRATSSILWGARLTRGPRGAAGGRARC